jgi:hypothetical protein
MGTAPQRSASRRWTVRGLVVGALAVPALVAGIATANAAEMPHADAPAVPHADTHLLDETLAEHGVSIDEEKLTAVPGTETESAKQDTPADKVKKDKKDKD